MVAIRKTISITKKQADYVTNNQLNLSRFVQKALSDKMNKVNKNVQ